MEQWIGSVHSKMAWRELIFFKFGVYRVLEKSSSSVDLFPKTVTCGIFLMFY